MGLALSVLIPWRSDHGHRQKLFDYLLPLWQALEPEGVEVCIGQPSPEGAFNCSQALNRAFLQATTDKMMIFGADYFPDLEVLREGALALDSRPWVPLLSQTGYYSEASTYEILAGRDPAELNLEYTLPFATAIIGFTRNAMVASGGLDERFCGWGYEDAAHRQTLIGLYGDQTALPYTSRCFWHPSDHRTPEGPNRALMDEYEPLKDRLSTLRFLEERGSFL